MKDEIEVLNKEIKEEHLRVAKIEDEIEKFMEVGNERALRNAQERLANAVTSFKNKAVRRRQLRRSMSK